MSLQDQNPSAVTESTGAGAAPKPFSVSGAASRVDRLSPSSASAGEHSTAGRTTIADGVVSKVAGIAAREVRGVYALGGGGARAFGAIRDAMNATDLGQGVKVEVGETQAAVDITLVVEYPEPIQDVADNVRASVSDAITTLVGLEVVEVNVEVNDVHLPGDDDEDKESRVS